MSTEKPKKADVPRPSLGWAVIPVILGVIAFLLPPDGQSRGHFAQFLGRFHPLLVHLPIGLLVVVPFFEIIGALPRYSALRTAAGFLLPLAAASAILAAIDGWFLARFGGYGGALVTRHMWAGILLSFVTVIAACSRHALNERRFAAGWFYPLLLAVTLGLLTWTGHEGGNLSHGEGFLTKYMPGKLKTLFGVAEPEKPAAATAVPVKRDTSAYFTLVQPIFDKSCVSCHGPDKKKGGLRMDRYELVMKGGEDGAIVTPADAAASELIRRVTLPKDDDDFMPSDGHNLLTAAQIDTLRTWILWGAPGPSK